MPGRRALPIRRSEREEMVAYIHGIDPQGDIAHILVYKRGARVRFTGKLGAHQVSPSKSAALAQWTQEAETVWQLDDAIGIPRGWMNDPKIREKLELMNTNAAQKK